MSDEINTLAPGDPGEHINDVIKDGIYHNVFTMSEDENTANDVVVKQRLKRLWAGDAVDTTVDYDEEKAKSLTPEQADAYERYAIAMMDRKIAKLLLLLDDPKIKANTPVHTRVCEDLKSLCEARQKLSEGLAKRQAEVIRAQAQDEAALAATKSQVKQTVIAGIFGAATTVAVLVAERVFGPKLGGSDGWKTIPRIK